ncbi:hypothetical protein LZC95_15860 [Pendulispora brunnea]|uniref:Uncharacterized protein n=1 Tax=Pendulispora brunnea TaxID=2905690 RepID=A0ABZ2KKX6_9BACT
MNFKVGPWIWGARTDLAAFGGSAVLALAVVALGHASGISQARLPEWSYVALVLAIDVAHVWATLFRTYFDREEWQRRKVLYAGLPITGYIVFTVLHWISPMAFWRTLAYLAVFHFVRQQVGWVRIYQHRARPKDALWERRLEQAVVYASTCVPLLVWHASLPRAFQWFVPGDFASAAWLRAYLPALKAAYATLLVVFFTRTAWRLLAKREIALGKCVVITTTAICWWVGICATDSDLDFTATNVILHGVPYMVLLWHYGRARREERPNALGSRIIGAGVGAFFGTLLAFAFIEEMLWDRLVWHDRAWLFGGSDDDVPLAAAWQIVIVPLLALPQVTHYAMDAVLWRRKDRTPALARSLLDSR